MMVSVIRPTGIACDPKYLHEPPATEKPNVSFRSAVERVVPLLLLLWFMLYTVQWASWLDEKLFHPPAPIKCEVVLPALRIPDGILDDMPILPNLAPHSGTLPTPSKPLGNGGWYYDAPPSASGGILLQPPVIDNMPSIMAPEPGITPR